MIALGQICLLVALVSSGYAAFACIVGWRKGRRGLARIGIWAALLSGASLTAVVGILVATLVTSDLRCKYVAEYGHRLLPWYYAVSACWVGQAGSLLVWAWMLTVLALVYRFWPRRQPSELREPAFGLLMAYLCCLVAIMAFGADPMQPSLSVPREGRGLSPLLQHPAMLFHPPIVFLGYAGWAIPCCLALAALLCGRLDATWVREARPWALFSWATLGAGILLGADWAYEELGWGGYWGWDPVENGSLIPWLTGTAMIHAALAWHYRNTWKKTAVGLAIATFALCNFATFLTRSGIFSSLHAFSQSPIGWMFLALMAALAAGGGVLMFRRRAALAGGVSLPSLWARETVLILAAWALLLSAAVAIAGTLTVPLSNLFLARRVAVGPAFYNYVMVPVGLVVLATTGIAPLLRWGAGPTDDQKRLLLVSVAAGAVSAALAAALGVRHPLALVVAGLSGLAFAALAVAAVADLRRGSLPRRQYAGFVIHMGLVCLAVGVTGSSLGTRQHEAVMHEGETLDWAGYSIRVAGLVQRTLPDRFIAEARLEVSSGGGPPFTVLPAQHWHLAANGWTTEVAIHSTWGRDFYAIFHGDEGGDRVRLTFIENPMMRWIWLSGVVSAAGAVVSLWPARRRESRLQSPSPVSVPHGASQRRTQSRATPVVK
jgi:cytochrome c-type biogenesis protein CcmF